MPLQPVLIHPAIQAERPTKIYGTRPKRPTETQRPGMWCWALPGSTARGLRSPT
jgi:hypothetical protein